MTTDTYDALDRLTQDNPTGTNAHVYHYAYDATSNRTLSSETGVNITWTYDWAGRLVTSLATTSLTTYTYDANGNLTNIQPPAAGPVIRPQYQLPEADDDFATDICLCNVRVCWKPI